MTNEVAAVYFKELRHLLRGYPWVMENVNAIISLGTTERQNGVEFDPDAGAVRDYSGVEKLTLLVDEIEASVLQPASIAENLIPRFSLPGLDINRIVQVDEDGRSQEFRYGPFIPTDEDIQSETESVREALVNLRNAIGIIRERIQK